MALALVDAAQRHAGLVLAIVRDTHGAHTLEQDLRVFAGDLPVLHFPDWETLPYDQFSPHPDIVSQRVAALYRLPQVTRGVLVVPVSTLLQRLPPTRYIAGNALLVRKGQRLDLDAEKQRLQASGYRNVGQVLDPGDFAVRGALLDIFAMGAAEPYRIELFDDTVESIRSFDPETQRSQHPVEEIRLLPAREFPLDDAACQAVRARLRERFDIDPRRCPLYQDLKQGVAPAGIEYYLPLFFARPETDAGAGAPEATQTLFDYLGCNALAVLGDGALEAADSFWANTGQRYEQRRHDLERPVLPPEELFVPADALRARLNTLPRIELCAATHAQRAQALPLGEQPAPLLALTPKGEPAAALKSFLAHYPGRVLLVVDSAGRREALLEWLDAEAVKPTVVADWHAFIAAESAPRWAITVAPLDDGFALTAPPLCVLTERQLYPDRAAQPRRRKRAGRDPESIIRDLTEIAIGAPIVHEDHGVGRYQGLVTLDAGGQRAEFLQIEYAKGDKLYVPVAQLHLVSRYAGASPESAPLHSLGGEAWEKAKRRAAEKVRDVAAELLEIQARRHARQGLALPLHRAEYEPFAAAFAFEETPDQLAAIDAVIADLGQSTPMDRVVCGDVGFGKTEVAVRAAFVAANAGKQVAVLVPTTLLAEQHFNNFSDRFSAWPIKLAELSRFRSPKEQAEALEALKDGKLDIVIGTHRLIQKDVKFARLGLVILDEEHRFGVRQKEQLKALRAEVDVLTLTATPIPRTLAMSLEGIRDFSIIATAPQKRLAVKTFVQSFSSGLIREAVLRELKRGGQVYFLHNEVSTIQNMFEMLVKLLPEARIRVGHGQQSERELEQVMRDFYQQRFDVLLCTTIIETGIDIPTANTILINRADKFGLAQLHQLRGRVGRSHHQAFAYLLVEEDRTLTAQAKKRLEAIQLMEELGSGFHLAMHDLEIRGCGEVLGDKQSGEILEVGFSLYNDMLSNAVASLKAGHEPNMAQPLGVVSEINLHVPALLPVEYCPDVHERLVLYKRLASVQKIDDLTELQEELIDRFGSLPDPARALIDTHRLRLVAKPLGVMKVDASSDSILLQFVPQPPIDPGRIIQLIQSRRDIKLAGADRLRWSASSAPEVRAANVITLFKMFQ